MPLNLCFSQALPDTFIIKVKIVFYAKFTLILKIVVFSHFSYFLVIFKPRWKTFVHFSTSLNIADASLFFTAEDIHIFWFAQWALKFFHIAKIIFHDDHISILAEIFILIFKIF